MRHPRVLCFAARGLLLASLGLMWSSSALAAPPSNDTCQGAMVVPPNGPFPFLSPLVTNINEATLTGDPAAPSACVADQSFLKSGAIWYSFTPAASALYHVSVSDDTATTVIDTVMAVYQSQNGCAGPLTLVDCNDDQGGLTSALELSLAANTQYFILVWAVFTTPKPDTATVQLRVSRPTVPANDTCAGAELIPADGPFPFLTQVTDTTLAGTSGNPPLPSCAPANSFDSTVWYRFTPSVSRTYVISTCDDTSTTVYDTLLAIYTSTSPCSGFTRVACNDNISNSTALSFRSVLTNAFTAGTTYYIVAGDPSGEGVIPGETLMQLRIFEPRGPVATVASAITPTSAVLNGTIPNLNTALVKAWFEWGTNTSYGNSTPIQSVKTGTNDLQLSAPISSLTALSYHYRLVISNCFGLARSPDQTVIIRPTLTAQRDSLGFRLSFTGNSGQQYTVLSATTLSGWQETGTATNLGNGTFEYRDPNSATTPARFFQIRSP